MSVDSEPLPPPVSKLIQNPLAVATKYSPRVSPRKWRKSNVQRSLLDMALWRTLPDTPVASFYRIYEFFVVNWNIAFRNELEYFCTSHPDWVIADLPKPDDTNHIRLATLAVLSRLMCKAFNRRIELGLPRDAPAIIEDFEELKRRPKVLEHPPDWANEVTPLQELVFIPDTKGEVLSVDHPDVSMEFKEMNIIVRMPHIHFT